MAEIQPLRALRYDLSVVGALGDVTAPPYDVIDAAKRSELLARSPYNVVAVDLPEGEPDPYLLAEDLFSSWQLQGAVTRDREPAMWAHTQEYSRPDGARHTRHGVFCRVRIEDYGAGRIRPHERTHPGPREDRLRLTRATRTNLSAIFSLYSDPSATVSRALDAALLTAPWGEVRDEEDTVHRLWRVSEPATIAAMQDVLADNELLIADGHHRYETARVYADEIGGEGEHRYVLMCLVALEDPGLTVFPTHRLVRGLDAAGREALAAALARDFEVEEVPLDQVAPPESSGPLAFGYFDAQQQRPLRLTLRDQAIADAALPGRSRAYRHLDTGVLEELVIKRTLGRSDEDISHLRDLAYARDPQQALARVRSGEYDAAFLMAPTPVTQIQDVATSAESMPPKTTYFYPKLLTGLLFNPLF